MMLYLDSSVLLRYLLNADEALLRIGTERQIGSSELIEIECRRVLQRERLESRLDDARYSALISSLEGFLEMISIFEIGHEVKRRASGSFPTVIGTLDAIHLSSALLWQENAGSAVVIFTYDRQLALCARAVGIAEFRPEG
jgi:predicted nucleic acid-binding protein